MRTTTINTLLSLANEAYAANEPADNYACNAACHAASETAKKYSEECADTASLLAVLAQLKSSHQATQFSAALADSAALKFAHDRSLTAARNTFSHRRTPVIRPTTTPYTNIINPLTTYLETIEDQLHSNYQAAFAHDTTTNQKAKHAAHYTYRHTYACARSAYIIATLQANKAQNISKRAQFFKSAMSQRLNQDLTYDHIQPSLLLQMMCSTTLAVIAGMLLIGGSIVIVCALSGVGGISLAIGLTTGGLSAVTGTGLFIGGFFARGEQDKINETNDRIEETNTIF